MSYRYMRAVVLFDLPTDTKKSRREATRFRNFLLDDGFDMLQYSVYTRICPDRNNAETHLNRIQKIAPENGSIRMLMLTENQFAGMKIIAGDKTSQEISNTPTQLAFF